MVEEARTRLKHIDLDTLFSSAQLEQILSDNSRSLFPLVHYSARPDFVVDCLSHGRFAVLADGAPIAAIAPVNFSLLLKSPEDIYFPFHIVAAEMLIRYFGFMIALFLPGFWVALSSYNMDQLPFPLLATLVITMRGLPLTGPLEALFMLALFEVFREAGVRLPKAVGQTVAVVGGIIVGDAVIRAGLTSTMMLVVAALTAVSTFTLVNQTLAYGVGVLRFLILACSSFLGMYGFILGTLAVVLHLSRLESFGIPYLAPLSPLRRNDVLGAMFRKTYTYRGVPQFLKEEDTNRRGGSP